MTLLDGDLVDGTVVELVFCVFVAVGFGSVLDCGHFFPTGFEDAEGGEGEDCRLEGRWGELGGLVGWGGVGEVYARYKSHPQTGEGITPQA